MPRPFSKSTAEQVIQVVACVQAHKSADSTQVQAFCDLAQAQADDALSLACDLGLIRGAAAAFEPATHLLNFIATPDESRKAALLRIALESFEPFVCFRQRLVATESVDQAARETKALLDLTAHREEIKDTILSLGTYTGAILSLGGGRYEMGTTDVEDPLASVAESANDLATSEQIIRVRIGQRSNLVARQDVVIPLAEALLKARGNDPRGAVGDASRAVESFLAEIAVRMTVSLVGANGINQKLDKFRQANQLPKKIVESAKYLGQVRNAADHGIDIDPDVGAVWEIEKETGLIYVCAACAFIRSCLEREAGGKFVL